MIPRQTDNVAVSEGSVERGQFAIEMNPEMFKLLSGGVYSDKPAAVIRELASNAADSHKEAGNSDPFTVRLPSEISPVLIIRDDGTGLCHDDVISLYTRYGHSSKRNSNDFTGKLGIGSKSPFSYTSAFSIESRFEGERRSYTAYIDASGIPSITYEGAAPTDEHNGLTVSVPIKGADIEDFRAKGQSILQWFDPAPTGVRPIKYLARYNGWTMRDNDDRDSYVASGSYARMGNVVYRIDRNKLGSDDLLAVLGLPLVIDFAIGDLDITASRESLSYDADTIAAIKARLQPIVAEILQEYQAQVDAEPTPYLAFRRKRLLYKAAARPLDDLIDRRLTYRGAKINSSSMAIKLDRGKYPGTTLKIWKASEGRRYRNSTLSYPLKTKTSNDLFLYEDDSLHVFYNDGTVKNWQRRLEADLGYDAAGGHLVVAIVTGDTACITDAIGDYPIKNLADIEPVPVDHTTNSSYRRDPPPKLYTYFHGDWAKTNHVMTALDVYVRVFDKSVAPDDPIHGEFNRYYDSAFLNGRDIYGVPSRYKSDPGGQHLKTFIDAARVAHLAANPDLARRRWLADQRESIPESIRAVISSALDKREFRAFKELLTVPWTDHDEEVRKQLNVPSYETKKADINVEERLDQIYKKWPLLKWMRHLYDYENAITEALAYINA